MYHGQRVPGFPAHPHRGFETVTIARQGYIDHSDSLGAAGRFGNGDVQWMTAGKGVQHCEMFPLIHTDKTNPTELFQIWLNLPKSKKSAEPYFSMLWAPSIPEISINDENNVQSVVRLIAGEYQNHSAPKPNPDSWAANPENHVNIWTIQTDANGHFTIPSATAGINRTLYFYEGSKVTIADRSILPGYMIRLKADENVELKNGNAVGKFLLLEGRPINEPVVQYGPFVVNTQEEVQQTYTEFRRTQFGGWPWPSYENVHKDATGRFAKYPDGSVITP